MVQERQLLLAAGTPRRPFPAPGPRPAIGAVGCKPLQTLACASQRHGFREAIDAVDDAAVGASAGVDAGPAADTEPFPTPPPKRHACS